MNIKQAKEQIKNAITAYFTRDESGEYLVPTERQRPVFLIGPPGIGKTAIMEQIAAEMGVGLLSYSMTHHTRQSALGLPVIRHKKYKDLECEISEYTMSEIIASVYDLMEETGVQEGILFLDEINCVSETLAPIMLQFLQYKVFGRHKVPDGWIVVTAGNPPEYNNSVREFDIVTWDRLKRIDVEADYGVWKEYAWAKGLHPAVLTYLEIKKDHFYKVESTVDGKAFVTARGWEDLSQMIRLYEMHGIKADEFLISQYIQNKSIAKSFALYYDLFLKYQSDYQVAKILDGKASGVILTRARDARFDERLSLIGLLLDSVKEEVRHVILTEKSLTQLMLQLRDYKKKLNDPKADAYEIIQAMMDTVRESLAAGKKAGSLTADDMTCSRRVLHFLDTMVRQMRPQIPSGEAFALVKKEFDGQVAMLKESAKRTSAHLENMFGFLEKVFADGGQEMLIVVTELTANTYTAGFISKFGCDAYFRHNKDLLVFDREKEIRDALDDLGI